MNTPRFSAAAMSILRSKCELTYQELADAIGSSKSYMWELENGISIDPSGSIVFRLSKALKAKMEDFYK